MVYCKGGNNNRYCNSVTNLPGALSTYPILNRTSSIQMSTMHFNHERMQSETFFIWNTKIKRVRNICYILLAYVSNISTLNYYLPGIRRIVMLEKRTFVLRSFETSVRTGFKEKHIEQYHRRSRSPSCTWYTPYIAHTGQQTLQWSIACTMDEGGNYRSLLSVTIDCGKYPSIDIVGDNRL